MVSKELSDWTFKELADYAAERVLERLITGNFHSIRDLTTPIVDMAVRWSAEREKKSKEQANGR